MDCHSVQSEAQTRPRKFLENEIEKERKETFDMREEELWRDDESKTEEDN